MENIILKVTLNDGGSLNTLAQLDKSVAALNGKNIQIKVDTSGIQALNAATLKSLSAVAKEENARARLIVAQTTQAKLQNGLAIAQEKTAQAAQKTRQEQEKSAQTQEKTAQAEIRRSSEAQKGANIEQQRALLAEKMAAQYDRAALSASKLSGSGMTITGPTDLQSRIDGMVGLGRATKSAADSASIFNAVHSSMGNLIGVDKLKLAQGVSGMQAYIRSLDGMANATVKANGITRIGENTFQRYDATVKNADGSFKNYSYSVDAATGATYKMEKGVTSVDTAATRAGDTISNLIVKVAKWAAVTTLVYGPIRALKNAVKELKNVDTELVTIQKVTNMTADQMDALAASAYRVAGAYGSTASNYLASVSEFAKAGYTDLSDSLGQLALKTQVVGDTDQRTANQFLLSVDAAYKYKGSVDKLNAVLDGANQIGNEYATNVQKIAEGLGVVSSVAESAHTDVSELSAAIGTITAVTQRSGSEAARAIRAIYLNILGNTEIALDEDSGETWTADEILAMQDALVKFNIATRETVDGMEQLRNPMKVIGDIAKQVEAGLISEADLNDLIQDLGGKLRSNQLLALINNWDMYEKMLATYQTAAGSADQEFGIYMNSWEAKLNQLSAAWTEFVSEFGIEDAIKQLLDLGITLLRVGNNDFVQATVKTAALTAAVALLMKVFTAARGKIAASKFAAEMTLAMGKVASGATVANASMSLLNRTLFASPLFWVGALFALAELVDALTVDFDDQREAVKNLSTELDELNGKYAELSAKSASELTENDRQTLLLLKAEIENKKRELAEAQQKEYNIFSIEQTDVQTGPYGEVYGQTQSQAMQQAVADYNALLDVEGKTYAEQEKLNGQRGALTSAMTAYATQLQEYKNNGVELNAADKALLATILQLIDAQDGDTAATQAGSDANAEAATQVSALNTSYKLLQKAQDEVEKSGKISDATLETLTSRYPELSKYLVQTADGYVLSKTALDDYLVSQRAEYELALNNAQTAAQKVVDTEELKRRGIDATTMSIRQQLIAMAALYQTQFVARRVAQGDTAGEATRSFDVGNDSAEYASYAAVQSALKRLEAAQKSRYDFGKAAGALKNGSGGSGGGSSGSGGGSSGKKPDTLLEKLQAQMTDEEHRIFLMGKQGNQEEAVVALYRKMQERIHAVAEEYRKKGYKETSDEIQTLQKMYWEYADNIEGIHADMAKAQEEAWNQLEEYMDGVLKKAADARDDQLDDIDELIAAENKLEKDRLADIDARLAAEEELTDNRLAGIDLEIAAKKKEKDEKDEQLTMEQKLLDVEKARKALHNAQNERNVREIHADGSWEWIANRGTVENAKEALQNAENGLEEYRQELAYQAVLNALKAEKDRIKAEYDLFFAALQAEKDRVETEHKSSIEYLQAEREWVEAEYDAFEEQWDALKESLQDPTADISEILDDIAKNGTPAMKAAVESAGGLLLKFSEYLNGAMASKPTIPEYDQDRDYHADMLNADSEEEFWRLANLRQEKIDAEGLTGKKTNAAIYEEWLANRSEYAGSSGGSGGSGGGGGSGGSGGGYHFNDKTYDSDRDYANDMLNASTQEEFEHWADKRQDKIEGEGISDVQSNKDLYEQWAESHSFDSGGVAHGIGAMAKKTAEAELVLPPELTRQILNPDRGAAFTQFSENVARIFDSSRQSGGQGNFTAKRTAFSDNHSVNYFINGVKVGSDQVNRPFSQVLSTLGIHTEQ